MGDKAVDVVSAIVSPRWGGFEVGRDRQIGSAPTTDGITLNRPRHDAE
jgi:hypothetical protein